MNKVFPLGLSVALASVSCSTLEDSDSVKPEEVLELTVQGQTQLIGNGKSRTAFLVRVPKSATQREITFTTSGGFFIYNNLKAIKQFADSIAGDYCFTRTVLRSDTVKGPVYIIAETPFARRRVSVTFTK